MPKYCVKKPFTVLVGAIMVIVLGFISFTKITTDLLPSMSFPYVMAVTTYPGASPEKIESSVTEVVERSLGRVNKVKNVSSVSSENMSMVMLEFEEDTNMDSAMVKLSTACEQLDGQLPEEAGVPMLMEISPDMMATMTVALDYEGKDIKELSRFVEEEITPFLERKDGVASVASVGLSEEKIEIRLNQSKIDEVNDRLLSKMDETFAQTKAMLDQKENDLKSATAKLENGSSTLPSEQDATFDELTKYSRMLDEALASAASYESQLNGLFASQGALQTEKDAYMQQVVPAYDSINQALSQFHTNIPELAKDKQKFEKIHELLEGMIKLQPENQELQSMYENFTWENIKTLDEKVNTRIPQIDTELGNLETKISAARVLSDQVNAQVESAKNNYASVEKGKLSAAAAFGAASAGLDSGKEKLAEAQVQLNEARTEYDAAREEALKNGNIDALVSMDMLSQLIYAQNFEMPAGYIPEGNDKILLKVGDTFNSLEELDQLLLCDMEGIGEVRVCDIADVRITDNSEESYAKINGNDAVILNITKSSASGTSKVSKTLNQSLDELLDQYKGLHVTSLMDQGEYIKVIIHAVLKNLILGAILAILVLALFLKDLKPTIVVAFSIPMSVLFSIVLMFFSNVTVNLISLSGLALGVGMLVDNSIVVIENIYRLRNEGISAPKAAVLGARQVSGAIFASTLTTICVFLPIVFTEGMTRELFTDMGLTIAYSLIASLIVALTFVPAMSATVLKTGKTKEHKWFDRMVFGYEKTLEFCLNKKWIPIGAAVILLIISIIGAGSMGMEMIPSMSGGAVSVSVEMNEEKEQNEIYEEVDQFCEDISSIKGVETVGAMSGSAMMTMDAGEEKKETQFTFYVQPSKEYENKTEKISKNIEKIGKKNKDIVELNASASNMDMSALGGNGMQVQIEGQDLEDMLAVSEDVMKILDKVEGFENITNGQEEGEKAIRLILDKDAAMKQGLTVAQIYGELSENLKTEASAIDLTLNGKDYEVKVIDEDEKLTTENLLDFPLEGQKKDSTGKDVKETHLLGEFASVEDAAGITSIHRDNQARFITVSAETKEGYNTALLSRKVEKQIQEFQAPDGIEVEIAGEVMNIQDTMMDMFKMIALAIAFIYMIMVAQFQSLLSPFIVLLTIPLAFTGGLLALWMSGETISMIAMMGFLVLAGVVVNNGIVFVDYVNQLRIAGRSKREALIETGKTRMRPILMTALTTILAMSTMVFSQESTAKMSKGMAVVTIGGLTYATFMTLYIVPVLYDILFRRELHMVDVEEDGSAEEENIVLTIDSSSHKNK